MSLSRIEENNHLFLTNVEATSSLKKKRQSTELSLNRQSTSMTEMNFTKSSTGEMKHTLTKISDEALIEIQKSHKVFKYQLNFDSPRTQKALVNSNLIPEECIVKLHNYFCLHN